MSAPSPGPEDGADTQVRSLRMARVRTMGMRPALSQPRPFYGALPHPSTRPLHVGARHHLARSVAAAPRAARGALGGLGGLPGRARCLALRRPPEGEVLFRSGSTNGGQARRACPPLVLPLLPTPRRPRAAGTRWGAGPSTSAPPRGDGPTRPVAHVQRGIMTCTHHATALLHVRLRRFTMKAANSLPAGTAFGDWQDRRCEAITSAAGGAGTLLSCCSRWLHPSLSFFESPGWGSVD